MFRQSRVVSEIFGPCCLSQLNMLAIWASHKISSWNKMIITLSKHDLWSGQPEFQSSCAQNRDPKTKKKSRAGNPGVFPMDFHGATSMARWCPRATLADPEAPCATFQAADSDVRGAVPIRAGKSRNFLRRDFMMGNSWEDFSGKSATFSKVFIVYWQVDQIGRWFSSKPSLIPGL